MSYFVTVEEALAARDAWRVRAEQAEKFERECAPAFAQMASNQCDLQATADDLRARLAAAEKETDMVRDSLRFVTARAAAIATERDALREQLATAERRHVETLTAESAARDGLRAQVEMLRGAGNALGEVLSAYDLKLFGGQAELNDWVAALAASESDWLAWLKERVAYAVWDAGCAYGRSTRYAGRDGEARVLDVKAIAAATR